MEYMVNRCVFNSTDPKDIRYIYSDFNNKKEIVRFDSSLGKFVGYTELGVKTAEKWNNDPSDLARMRALKEAYCLINVDIDYQFALSKSVEPTVKLYSTTPPAGSHPAMLVCRVYDFFPKLIKVSWLRDGQEVTSDFTTTDEMQNGDWYYQVHSTLEYTPRSGEKISCRVEHASLKEPLITDWSYIMSYDLHAICEGCLGPDHASLALTPRSTCPSCRRLPQEEKQRRLAIFSPLEGKFPVADQCSPEEALGIFGVGRESDDSSPETATDVSTPFLRTEDAEADTKAVQAQGLPMSATIPFPAMGALVSALPDIIAKVAEAKGVPVPAPLAQLPTDDLAGKFAPAHSTRRDLV
ncbi:hypothetical protein GOODEAATRI_020370 [Goodea atripinnis]|uniref:Ig-like domain-containing protein n=1 Tax=Goodea atripinnis TaxID=208336 RepID=A0ABV0P6F4_9TELE